MSYTGLIAELPLGPDGLTGNKNLSQIRPTQLLEATNVTYENGTLQKEGGASKYNATAITGAPRVIGGYDYWPSDGVQRMIVVTSAGNVYKDSGAASFPVTLKSGLSIGGVSTQVVFAEGGVESAALNKKLFIFIAGNAPQVLEGDDTTTGAIATPPADWATGNPTFGFPHEGRMTGGGNLNDPHRWYYSRTTDHEDWTGSGAGSLSIFPGEGERLVAGVSYKGLAILFKKPTGIYAIDTSNGTPSNWRVYKVSGSLGLPSSLAFCIGQDDIMFMDSGANVHALSAVQEFGDVSTSDVTSVGTMAPFLRSNLNMSRLDQVQAVYYMHKKEAHFALCGTGASTKNRRLVLDFNRPDLPRFRFSDRDTAEAIWLRKDSTTAIPQPVYGDDEGFVWLMDRATKSYDGTGYNAQFQLPHNDLSYLDPKLGTVRKMGDFLELVVEPTGNWNMNVDVLWDGAIKQTVTFNMGVTGAGLGSFTLDTDRLAGDQVINKKRRITGSGRRFSVIGRNNGAGEDFSVAKFLLHFRPGDERL